jgi:predicted phage-related endonuclease
MGSLPLFLSASRSAAILGLSRYQSPVDVWLDIMAARDPEWFAASGYTREEFAGNASTRFGLGFEPAVIRLAERAQGEEIGARELAVSRYDHDFITAHLDGIYKTARTVHEGKTTTISGWRDNWGEPGTDKIPVEYASQIQHQLLCCGLERAIVSVLVFPTRPDEWEAAGLGCEIVVGDTGVITRKKDDGPALSFALAWDWARVLCEMGFFHQYTVEADRVAQAAMIGAYVDFWSVNVLGRTPPEATRYEDCRRLFVAPKGTIVADDTLEREAAEYRAITAEISAMEKRKSQLKTDVIARMARAAEHPIDGDSCEKWILRGASGKRLASFDGKIFR